MKICNTFIYQISSIFCLTHSIIFKMQSLSLFILHFLSDLKLIQFILHLIRKQTLLRNLNNPPTKRMPNIHLLSKCINNSKNNNSSFIRNNRSSTFRLILLKIIIKYCITYLNIKLITSCFIWISLYMFCTHFIQ